MSEPPGVETHEVAALSIHEQLLGLDGLVAQIGQLEGVLGYVQAQIANVRFDGTAWAEGGAALGHQLAQNVLSAVVGDLAGLGQATGVGILSNTLEINPNIVRNTQALASAAQTLDGALTNMRGQASPIAAAFGPGLAASALGLARGVEQGANGMALLERQTQRAIAALRQARNEAAQLDQILSRSASRHNLASWGRNAAGQPVAQLNPNALAELSRRTGGQIPVPTTVPLSNGRIDHGELFRPFREFFQRQAQDHANVIARAQQALHVVARAEPRAIANTNTQDPLLASLLRNVTRQAVQAVQPAQPGPAAAALPVVTPQQRQIAGQPAPVSAPAAPPPAAAVSVPTLGLWSGYADAGRLSPAEQRARAEQLSSGAAVKRLSPEGLRETARDFGLQEEGVSNTALRRAVREHITALLTAARAGANDALTRQDRNIIAGALDRWQRESIQTSIDTPGLRRPGRYDEGWAERRAQLRDESYEVLRGAPVPGDISTLITGMRHAPVTDIPLFSGANRELAERLARLQPGQHVTLPLTSFSESQTVAEGFAQSTRSTGGQRTAGTVLHLEPGAQTLVPPRDHTAAFSHGARELEHLTAGRFEVSRTEVDAATQLTRVFLRAAQQFDADALRSTSALDGQRLPIAPPPAASAAPLSPPPPAAPAVASGATPPPPSSPPPAPAAAGGDDEGDRLSNLERAIQAATSGRAVRVGASATGLTPQEIDAIAAASGANFRTSQAARVPAQPSASPEPADIPANILNARGASLNRLEGDIRRYAQLAGLQIPEDAKPAQIQRMLREYTQVAQAPAPPAALAPPAPPPAPTPALPGTPFNQAETEAAARAQALHNAYERAQQQIYADDQRVAMARARLSYGPVDFSRETGGWTLQGRGNPAEDGRLGLTDFARAMGLSATGTRPQLEARLNAEQTRRQQAEADAARARAIEEANRARTAQFNAEFERGGPRASMTPDEALRRGGVLQGRAALLDEAARALGVPLSQLHFAEQNVPVPRGAARPEGAAQAPVTPLEQQARARGAVQRDATMVSRGLARNLPDEVGVEGGVPRIGTGLLRGREVRGFDPNEIGRLDEIADENARTRRLAELYGRAGRAPRPIVMVQNPETGELQPLGGERGVFGRRQQAASLAGLEQQPAIVIRPAGPGAERRQLQARLAQLQDDLTEVEAARAGQGPEWALRGRNVAEMRAEERRTRQQLNALPTEAATPVAIPERVDPGIRAAARARALQAQNLKDLDIQELRQLFQDITGREAGSRLRQPGLIRAIREQQELANYETVRPERRAGEQLRPELTRARPEAGPQRALPPSADVELEARRALLARVERLAAFQPPSQPLTRGRINRLGREAFEFVNPAGGVPENLPATNREVASLLRGMAAAELERSERQLYGKDYEARSRSYEAEDIRARRRQEEENSRQEIERRRQEHRPIGGTTAPARPPLTMADLGLRGVPLDFTPAPNNNLVFGPQTVAQAVAADVRLREAVAASASARAVPAVPGSIFGRDAEGNWSLTSRALDVARQVRYEPPATIDTVAGPRGTQIPDPAIRAALAEARAANLRRAEVEEAEARRTLSSLNLATADNTRAVQQNTATQQSALRTGPGGAAPVGDRSAQANETQRLLQSLDLARPRVAEAERALAGLQRPSDWSNAAEAAEYRRELQTRTDRLERARASQANIEASLRARGLGVEALGGLPAAPARPAIEPTVLVRQYEQAEAQAERARVVAPGVARMRELADQIRGLRRMPLPRGDRLVDQGALDWSPQGRSIFQALGQQIPDIPTRGREGDQRVNVAGATRAVQQARDAAADSLLEDFRATAAELRTGAGRTAAASVGAAARAVPEAVERLADRTRAELAALLRAVTATNIPRNLSREELLRGLEQAGIPREARVHRAATAAEVADAGRRITGGTPRVSTGQFGTEALPTLHHDFLAALGGQRPFGDAQALLEGMLRAPRTTQPLFQGLSGQEAADLIGTRPGTPFTMSPTPLHERRGMAEEAARAGEGLRAVMHVAPGREGALALPVDDFQRIAAGHFRVLRTVWDEEAQLYRVHVTALRNQLGAALTAGGQATPRVPTLLAAEVDSAGPIRQALERITNVQRAAATGHPLEIQPGDPAHIRAFKENALRAEREREAAAGAGGGAGVGGGGRKTGGGGGGDEEPPFIHTEFYDPDDPRNRARVQQEQALRQEINRRAAEQDRQARENERIQAQNRRRAQEDRRRAAEDAQRTTEDARRTYESAVRPEGPTPGQANRRAVEDERRRIENERRAEETRVRRDEDRRRGQEAERRRGVEDWFRHPANIYNRVRREDSTYQAMRMPEADDLGYQRPAGRAGAGGGGIRGGGRGAGGSGYGGGGGPFGEFADDFRTGLRGRGDLPIGQQLGQTFGISARYGAAYQVLNGVQMAIGAVVNDFVMFEEALIALSLATGRNIESNHELASSLGELATAAGFAPAVGVRVGARSVGLMGLADASAEQQAFASEQLTAIALRIARLGGADPEAIATQLAGVAQSNNIPIEALPRLEDQLNVAARRTGRDAADLLPGIAVIGQLGSQAGFSTEEIMSAVGRVGATTGQSGTSAAGSFKQVLSRAGDPDFQRRIEAEFGIEAVGVNLRDIIRNFVATLPSQEEVSRFSLQFGRGGSQQVAQILATSWGTIQADADAARNAPAGTGESMFNLAMSGLGQQVRLFGQELLNLGRELTETGLIDWLAALVAGARGATAVLTQLVEMFNALTSWMGPLRSVIFAVGELYLALRLLGAAGPLATGFRGVVEAMGLAVGARAGSRGAAAARGPAAQAAATAAAVLASERLFSLDADIERSRGAGTYEGQERQDLNERRRDARRDLADARTREARTSIGGALAGLAGVTARPAVDAAGRGLVGLGRLASLGRLGGLAAGIAGGVAGGALLIGGGALYGGIQSTRAADTTRESLSRAAGLAGRARTVDELRNAATAYRETERAAQEEQKFRFSDVFTVGLGYWRRNRAGSDANRREADAQGLAASADRQATALDEASAQAAKFNPINTIQDNLGNLDELNRVLNELGESGYTAADRLKMLNTAFRDLVDAQNAGADALIPAGGLPKFAQGLAASGTSPFTGTLDIGTGAGVLPQYLRDQIDVLDPSRHSGGFRGWLNRRASNVNETPIMQGFGVDRQGARDRAAADQMQQQLDMLNQVDWQGVQTGIVEDVNTYVTKELGLDPNAGPVALNRTRDLPRLQEIASRRAREGYEAKHGAGTYDQLPQQGRLTAEQAQALALYRQIEATGGAAELNVDTAATYARGGFIVAGLAGQEAEFRPTPGPYAPGMRPVVRDPLAARRTELAAQREALANLMLYQPKPGEEAQHARNVAMFSTQIAQGDWEERQATIAAQGSNALADVGANNRRGAIEAQRATAERNLELFDANSDEAGQLRQQINNYNEQLRQVALEFWTNQALGEVGRGDATGRARVMADAAARNLQELEQRGAGPEEIAAAREASRMADYAADRAALDQRLTVARSNEVDQFDPLAMLNRDLADIREQYAFAEAEGDVGAMARYRMEDRATQRRIAEERLRRRQTGRRRGIDVRDVVGLADEDVTAALENYQSIDADDVVARNEAYMGYLRALDARNRAATDSQNAVTELTMARTSDSAVAQARGQLEIARRNLGLEKEGTAAFNRAMAVVVRGERELAEAHAQAASTRRRLGSDLTNPLQQAEEDLRMAREATRRASTPEGRQQALLNEREARNRRDATRFDQRMSDLQTGLRLGDISKPEYLSALEAERDSIAARLAFMSETDNGYRQLRDQYNRTREAIKQATEEMSGGGQWNIGEIDVPTIYQVRRSIAARGGADSGGTVDNSQNTVVVNGADFGRVIQYINSILGQPATNVRTLQNRR